MCTGSGWGSWLVLQRAGVVERVVDLRRNVAARVRLLAMSGSGKIDPHDARAVAVVALRSSGLPQVEDHKLVVAGIEALIG